MEISGLYGQYQVEDQPFNRDGRFAQLYRIASPAGLVFKSYLDPVMDDETRKEIVRVRQHGRQVLVQRGEEVGSTPESSINWPIDIIETRAEVKGVIVPEIPKRFFRDNGKPRTLDFLLLRRAGPPHAATRVSVLIRLAEIFRWLAEHDLIHGDVSAKNVVWCEHPAPGAYLIDCDGLRRIGSYIPADAIATEGWIDPRLIRRSITAHDQSSDFFALTLAMYRGLLLNPGYFAPNEAGVWPVPDASRFPKGLDARIRDNIRRMLAHPMDPRARATPGQWFDLLMSVYLPGRQFDEDALAVLDAYAGLSAVPTRTKPRSSVAGSRQRVRGTTVATRSTTPPAPAPPPGSGPQPARKTPQRPTGLRPAPPPAPPSRRTPTPPGKRGARLIRFGRSAMPYDDSWQLRLWLFLLFATTLPAFLGFLTFPAWLVGALIMLSAWPTYRWFRGALNSDVGMDWPLSFGAGLWYATIGFLVAIGVLDMWLVFFASLATAGAWFAYVRINAAA